MFGSVEAKYSLISTAFLVRNMIGDEEMLFISYPKCSTCQKAKKWLDENNKEYTERHMVEDHPSYDELKEWYLKSGLPLKKFFNTSGLLYMERKIIVIRK